MVHRKLASIKLSDGRSASYRTTGDKVFAKLADMSLDQKIAYVLGNQIDEFIEEDSSIALANGAVMNKINNDFGNTLGLQELKDAEFDIASTVSEMVSGLTIEQRKALSESVK